MADGPSDRLLYLPDMLLVDGEPVARSGLLVGVDGNVEGLCNEDSAPRGTRGMGLPGKALLPGLANAHSHTFQRLFRGRAEGRDNGGDNFWTWREQMYRAAGFVSPEDLYDIARATFLEMVSAGITAVGEFHYLHRDAHGRAYDDPNLLASQVIAAAQSVGLRICLLRSAYFRAGFKLPPSLGQLRFYEEPDKYLLNLDDLRSRFRGASSVTLGAAPHSIRAVRLSELMEIVEFARSHGDMPLHLHISEQVGENEACIAEYGSTPIELLERNGVLSPQTTLIHAIHLTEDEFRAVAASGSTICSCPTTERNLGDGIFPADLALRLGIPIAFGTDSQAQIDILEDARELEYHLRLRDQQRAILDNGILNEGGRPQSGSHQPIGQSLFRSASSNGHTALGLNGGSLAIGQPADFFTVDLNDLSIIGLTPSSAGLASLESQAVFAVAKSAIRDVAVQGRLILKDGHHAAGEAIRSRYRAVQLRYESWRMESPVVRHNSIAGVKQ